MNNYYTVFLRLNFIFTYSIIINTSFWVYHFIFFYLFIFIIFLLLN